MNLIPLIALVGLLVTTPAFANSDAQLEERINQLQKQLDGMKQLQQEVDQLKAQLAQEKKERQEAKAAPPVAYAPSPTAAEVSSTSIGGYGEMAYSTFGHDTSNPSKADLLRFVMFLGHRFSDQLSFVSELEVEHAVASKNDEGEVEVEQAWLDYRFSDEASVKAGLFLIPLGFLNERHEPPTFYGVFRNSVERRIIPTTWREGGFGLHGALHNDFLYDVGVTTGFDAGKIDDPAFGIRSGHQELQLANANDVSVYGSLKYIGYPGLLLGAGIFSGNTGQDGASNPLLKGVDARMTLGEVHARYAAHRVDLQGLYALGTLDDAARVTAAIKQAAPKLFEGWYLQAAYHLWSQGQLDFAPFVRYEQYDIDQEEDIINGFLSGRAARDTIETIGFNFKPHPDVVLKMDYQNYERNSANSSFDLGLGYQF
jgi:hypothetical protein